MDEITAAEIKEAVQAIEFSRDVEFRDSYSGRHMHGRQCVGVTGSLNDLIAFALELGKHCVDCNVPEFRFDNMGRGFIAYFPNIPPEDADV